VDPDSDGGTPGAGMTLDDRSEMPHAHVVSFVDHDTEAVAVVTRWVEEGLARGDRVVVVVTEAHRAALEGILAAGGDAPTASGSLVVLDATRTLDLFLVDGTPDRDLFLASMGQVIQDAGRAGSPVRVFGEMVSVLWDQGHVEAALELESLWNSLGRVHPFSLLCSYSTDMLGGARLADVHRICQLHGAVVPPASYDSPAAAPHEAGRDGHAEEHERSALFMPVPQAVAAARRFVALTLERWDENDVSFDAAVVTSELATNAVVHGHSPFRASISRSADAVRIAIEDAGPGWPHRRSPTIGRLDGRGLEIVEALANRSGHEALPTGKVVWAELHTTLSA
jgi:anti-sigma regulatory factor (Ser/Thr protein kinase)